MIDRQTYTIELTEGEVESMASSARRYQSTAELMASQIVYSYSPPKMYGLEVTQEAMDCVLSILREQGLTRDSGLTDVKYNVAMLPLLPHELCNKIFDGVDWGELPDEIASVNVTIGCGVCSDFAVDDFAHPVFHAEYDCGIEDRHHFTLCQLKDTILTKYSIDTAVQKLHELVNGVD